METKENCKSREIKENVEKKVIYSAIEDNHFSEWADIFFASEYHWKRPIAVQEIAISFLRHCGKPITKANVLEIRNKLIDNLRGYCVEKKYIMNPRVVYGNDRSSKEPRRYAWVTEFIDDSHYKKDRGRDSVRCCYFYKLGEEPKDTSEILKCPDTDEEMEERRRLEAEDR